MNTAQIKITLLHLKPFIWRRVLVPHDISLPNLHKVIQTVMDWTNSHLHSFTTKTATYEPSFADLDGAGFSDFEGAPNSSKEADHKLCDLLSEPKSFCLYTYDFGDDWQHDILLEKLIPTDTRLVCPEILAGENASPPDDSGGIDGYCNLVEILFNPKHPEYSETRKWFGLKRGQKFDPTYFDLAATAAALRRLRV